MGVSWQGGVYEGPKWMVMISWCEKGVGIISSRMDDHYSAHQDNYVPTQLKGQVNLALLWE